MDASRHLRAVPRRGPCFHRAAFAISFIPRLKGQRLIQILNSREEERPTPAYGGRERIIATHEAPSNADLNDSLRAATYEVMGRRPCSVGGSRRSPAIGSRSKRRLRTRCRSQLPSGCSATLAALGRG